MSKKHYVTGKELHQEFQLSLEQDKPTDKLFKMFELIATRYSSKFNNLCDLDRNSCINYATMEAYLKWKEYNIERSDNIFSFYTEMIKNDLATSFNLIHKNSHRNISIDVLFTNQNT